MGVSGTMKRSVAYIPEYLETFSQVIGFPFRGGRQGDLDQNPRLDAGVWKFSIVSLVAGSALTGFGGLWDAGEFTAILLYTAGVWVLLGLYAYLLSRYVLRGTAIFASTLAAILLVLSVAYVAANLLALIASLPARAAPDLQPWFLESGIVYLFAQAIVLAIHLTVFLKRLNAFGPAKTYGLVLLLPVPLSALNMFLIFAAHFMYEFSGPDAI